MAMGRGPLILGGMIGLGAIGWALASSASAAPAATGPQSIVTTSVKVRRSRRQLWRGTTTPPVTLTPRPKYKVGDRLIIRNLTDKDPAVEGKAVVVMEAVFSDVVSYGPKGEVIPVTDEPGTWTYVTDLVIDGQPVAVTETSLAAK